MSIRKRSREWQPFVRMVTTTKRFRLIVIPSGCSPKAAGLKPLKHNALLMIFIATPLAAYLILRYC
jgi:hypothetical protein